MDILETNPAFDVVKVEKDGKWALKQFSTSKLLTQYIYLYINDLGHGFFKVEKPYGFYCGVIRYDGIEILPLKFKEISLTFNNSYFLVETYGHKGLFNLLGEEIVPCIYDYISIEKDFILVGETVHKPFPLSNSIKWGICDFGGHLLLKVKYDSIVEIKELGINKFDFNIYKINNYSKRKPSVVNCGRPFPSSRVFRNFYYYHYLNNDVFDIPLEFYIDKSGTYYIVVNKRGDAIHNAKSDDLKSDFYNYSLKPIPAKYVEPITLYDGNIICRKRYNSDDILGIINAKGDVILPFKYNEIITVPNTLRTYQVLKEGVHDIFVQSKETGLCEKLFKGKYYNMEYCGYTGEFAILYSTNNKCGLVSIKDRKKVIPCIYDNIYMENHHIIVLSKSINDNQVYLDIYSTEQNKIIRNGCNNIKTNPYYYGLRECKKLKSWIPFGDKKQITLAIETNGKWLLLNANLEDVSLPMYEDVEFFEDGIYCYENSAIVEVYNYFGRVKRNYGMDTIEDYDHGASWEELGQDEENYIINDGGDWILDND